VPVPLWRPNVTLVDVSYEPGVNVAKGPFHVNWQLCEL
ncbi:hypothetical protein CapIbe_024098, partial [Capra ibex]